MQTKKIDLESIKDKNTNGRRKKQKEMLLKASGQNYDLDSAANSSNENVEKFNKLHDVQSFDLKRNCSLDAKQDSSACEIDSQIKTYLFDSEDTTKKSYRKVKRVYVFYQ